MSTTGSYWERQRAAQPTVAAPPPGGPAAEQVVPVDPVPAEPPSQRVPRPLSPSVSRTADLIDPLPLVRLLMSLLILAFAITSLTAAEQNPPPSWLGKWGLLKPVPKSLDAYKTEMAILIMFAALLLLLVLFRAVASQFFSLLLGLYVMGLVTGNILSWNDPGRLWAYALIQTPYITTWIALGLSVMLVISSLWSSGSTRRVVGMFLVGSAVTGGTVAIVSSFAPTLPPLLFTPFG